MYVVYALLMIIFHPLFLYPFGDEAFSDARFEPFTVEGAQIQVRGLNDDAPAVLYFMGNGGALAYFRGYLQVHLNSGRGVVAKEYPGGGGISGAPSESRLKAQALASYDWLAAEHDGPIVLHGYSMGTGLALYVAANRPVDGVILDAPYARMCDLMTTSSWLPACYLPGVQRWNSAALADDIQVPVLILHGDADQMIPLEHGQKLADVLLQRNVDVEMQVFQAAQHHNLVIQPRYAGEVGQFIERVIR